MMQWLIVRVVKWALKRHLSLKYRNQIVITILDNVGALPFRSIIHASDDGTLLVNGRPLEPEQAKQLQAHARLALENRALELIRDQVAFTAIALGVHKVESNEQMYFARAALWWGQQQEELLKLLAQRQEPSLSMDYMQP